MLTSFLVRCPHSGCNWFGSLLPQGDTEDWRGYAPAKNVVMFECPRCQGHWRARVVGDDVETLPLEEMAVVAQA